MSTGCEDLNLERHFETLGVSGDASISAVKKAARKLFLKHHPDLNPGDRAECEEKTKRIVEAYRALLSAMKPGAADGKAADAAVESGDTEALIYSYSRSPAFRWQCLRAACGRFCGSRMCESTISVSERVRRLISQGFSPAAAK